MKKLVFFLMLASLSFKAFSSDLIDEIIQSINRIIPPNHTIVDVPLPTYNETAAASEFSKYLESRIHTSLSRMKKSVFSFTTKNRMEEFEADLSDTGDYDDNTMSEAACAAKPNGRLCTEFKEIGNKIDITLRYEPLGKISVGTSQTDIITRSKSSLPFYASYKPENFEQEKEKNFDVKKSKEIIKKSGVKNIEITAFMIDENEKKAEILYPGETVKFLIAVDRDSYISIKGIDAEGSVFWLPITNNFMEANTPRYFPDNDDIDYKVLDGVFGAERIYIYAASSPSGLPKQTANEKYKPNMLSDAARGFVTVEKKKNKNTALGVFCITYTIMPGKREN